ncbi:putative cysteine synthase [Actinoplanes missouriensis 431]|uniref:Putative cysteine synthase n=1 Tax=Actinoplanes missouriensis (strain ATCC 14538 / DSM 43046 / CBS 188.64 / JCM 3121 / NBRC 102363 / NCIMB 12654 / NRRL B-3342 / UNCC 431) TaxID=512565 RepID=I0HB04_ACTM4|nr:2,3-diaminopropionate biosynthesis protein SbnA [Actinoplanes missouriensis]BAL90191.1 putative cysteine synthase [Actinoplanes missouriensis 431]
MQSWFAATPVVRLDDDAVDLFAKLEFSNPNGSAKDRSAYWILKRGIERGEITEDTTVVESSSGNFALSMASFCRALGLSFIPVIDPNCNPATEGSLRALCDHVEKVTVPDEAGGYLRTRLDRVAQLRDQLKNAFWPDQYGSADAAEAHYALTGGEVLREFDELDYLFVGVGTGGTISGLSRRLKQRFPEVTVVAVDAVGSAIFGQEPAVRRIPGIGSSIVPGLLKSALIDDVQFVSELDTVAGCRQLMRRSGLYAGGSTGSVYAAIQRYFGARSESGGRKRSVLFLCADRGTAYAETVYNDAWVSKFLGDPDPDPFRPIPLSPVH